MRHHATLATPLRTIARITLPVTLLALPVLAAPGSSAPRLGPQPGMQAGRGRTHLLHLENGKVLRAPARQLPDGGWEVQSGRRWVPLPAGAVRRAALEKDVLERARELEDELGRDPEPTRVVAYADWLIAEGLYLESLATLDRLLADDPDCAPARELLARADLPIALPTVAATDDAEELAASLERFLAKVSTATPCARELAARRLATPPEVPGLIAALRAELVHPSARHRATAAFLLRRLVPGHEVRPLLNRAVLDASADVRHEASLALRDVDDPAVILPVVRALGSGEELVRRNAIQALGTMGYAAAVEPLVTHLAAAGSSSRAPHANVFVGRQIAYVSDYDVEVASGAAIADPKINVLTAGATLDAAVLGVSEVGVRAERAATMRALESLTGAAPGRTVRAWQGWWETHGEAWLAENPPPSAAATPRSPER